MVQFFGGTIVVAIPLVKSPSWHPHLELHGLWQIVIASLPRCVNVRPWIAANLEDILVGHQYRKHMYITYDNMTIFIYINIYILYIDGS